MSEIPPELTNALRRYRRAERCWNLSHTVHKRRREYVRGLLAWFGRPDDPQLFAATDLWLKHSLRVPGPKIVRRLLKF